MKPPHTRDGTPWDYNDIPYNDENVSAFHWSTGFARSMLTKKTHTCIHAAHVHQTHDQQLTASQWNLPPPPRLFHSLPSSCPTPPPRSRGTPASRCQLQHGTAQHSTSPVCSCFVSNGCNGGGRDSRRGGEGGTGRERNDYFQSNATPYTKNKRSTNRDTGEQHCNTSCQHCNTRGGCGEPMSTVPTTPHHYNNKSRHVTS